MFTSILNLEQGLTILDGVVCCMSALGLGLIIAWFYRRLGYCSHSFTVTLALLPALVQFVIMMVNGNLGTGIAVVVHGCCLLFCSRTICSCIRN